jgi:hypothetical protein
MGNQILAHSHASSTCCEGIVTYSPATHVHALLPEGTSTANFQRNCLTSSFHLSLCITYPRSALTPGVQTLSVADTFCNILSVAVNSAVTALPVHHLPMQCVDTWSADAGFTPVTWDCHLKTMYEYAPNQVGPVNSTSSSAWCMLRYCC